MTSEFKIVQCIEWYSKLPTEERSLESPVFLLEGNEWFFRFSVENDRYFSIYMELKKKNKDWKSCRVRFKIGFKTEDTFSLAEGVFSVSEHKCIKSFMMRDIYAGLPSTVMSNNQIKFFFYFDNIADPLLKTDSETSHISPELKLADSNFRLESLSNDFNRMLYNELDYDVELRCSDHTWKVHKNVLSSRSKVLQAMLSSDMVEGRTGVITLRDIDVPTVQHFLKYLYSGELPEMTVETAKQFYEMGDKYAVDCLKKSCANYLLRNLTPENACDILIVAVEHCDCSFKESIINFITMKKVFKNVDLWHEFRECHPKIAFEVYDRLTENEF